MPYPTHEQVHAIFKLLEEPPEGSKKFFTEHVSADVTFHAVGPPNASYAGVHVSKAAFMTSSFGQLAKAIKPPGMKLKVVEEVEGLIVDEQRGTAAIMFDTVSSLTHSGASYEQHYSWHVRFGEHGLITHIWSFFDHRHLEDVLGAELKRLGEA